MTKEELENLIRKIIREELSHHCLAWHFGITDEK